MSAYDVPSTAGPEGTCLGVGLVHRKEQMLHRWDLDVTNLGAANNMYLPADRVRLKASIQLCSSCQDTPAGASVFLCLALAHGSQPAILAVGRTRFC